MKSQILHDLFRLSPKGVSYYENTIHSHEEGKYDSYSISVYPGPFASLNVTYETWFIRNYHYWVLLVIPTTHLLNLHGLFSLGSFYTTFKSYKGFKWVRIRGIRNPGVRQCFGFCSADSYAIGDKKSVVQKPKHCLTPGFLIPLVRIYHNFDSALCILARLSVIFHIIRLIMQIIRLLPSYPNFSQLGSS